jgi:hypothetical protein
MAEYSGASPGADLEKEGLHEVLELKPEFIAVVAYHAEQPKTIAQVLLRQFAIFHFAGNGVQQSLIERGMFVRKQEHSCPPP